MYKTLVFFATGANILSTAACGTSENAQNHSLVENLPGTCGYNPAMSRLAGFSVLELLIVSSISNTSAGLC